MNDVAPITIDGADVNRAMQSVGVLAVVSISKWSARRIDKDVTEEVRVQKQAKGKAGSYNKNLLCGIEGPLLKVCAAFDAVRAFHYSRTLPWVDDPLARRDEGPRLLTHVLFNEYMTGIAQLKGQALAALDEFVLAYPSVVTTAIANLNGMGRIEDYPDVSEIKSRFRLFIDFNPIPERTGFVGLPPIAFKILGEDLEKKQQRQRDDALKAMWKVAGKRLSDFIERLSKEDAQPRESTVDGIREMIHLLQGWNIDGNTEVDEIIADIEQMLVGVDGKALRESKDLLTVTKAAAEGIVGKIEGWQ